MRNVMLGFMATMVLSACASSGSTTASPAASASASTRTSAPRRTTVIAAEEIAQGTFQTAADIVLTLRPQWDHVPIYLDNTPRGNFNELGDISASTVKEIRLLSASEAQMKWGMGVQRIIWVISK